jgi:hypothetical protein
LVFRATIVATAAANTHPPSPVSAAMAATTPKSKTPEEEITELRALVDTPASSLAAVKWNQGQLTIVVNRLQSDKLATEGDTSG